MTEGRDGYSLVIGCSAETFDKIQGRPDPLPLGERTFRLSKISGLGESSGATKSRE